MSKPTEPAAPRQRRKPRPKPQRFTHIVDDAETLTVTLVIRQVAQPSGKETLDTYVLEDIGTDTPGARGYSLTKPDGTVYNVELDGNSKTCDCKGHERHGHCKHADALACLLTAGKLGASAPGCKPISPPIPPRMTPAVQDGGLPTWDPRDLPDWEDDDSEAEAWHSQWDAA